MSKAARLLQQAVEQHEAGKAAEALSLCEQAIRHEPRNFLALTLAALLEHSRGQYQPALTWAEAALKAGPSNAEAYSTAGVILLALERYADAAERFRKALSLNPGLPGVHAQLGCALHKLDRLDEALTSYRLALSQNPDAQLFGNLAAALDEHGEHAAAVEFARRAAALQPDSASAQNNLGITLYSQGAITDALQAYDRALRLRSDYVDAHYNRSLAMLAAGDYARGWVEYEWRWRWPGFPTKRPAFPQPTWGGVDVRDRTVLVYAEQGIGDTIQFVRYIPLLAERGARVLLACPTELHQVVRGLEGVAGLVIPSEPLPAFDTHVALMSLPRLFQTKVENVPARIPYLRAPASRLPLINGEASGHLKVGLVWAGGDRHPKNRLRSSTLHQFLPVLGVPGIRFYSLQCGPRAAQLLELPGGRQIEDVGCRLRDFADTAGAVEQLDLVITVDTSVLHLAGALGRPVWGLISHACCWRWMRDRSDSPWYPTLRLFRQPRPGDWAGVMAQVEANLRELAAQRLS
jgi:Tfp pilus assembly protein PilF